MTSPVVQGRCNLGPAPAVTGEARPLLQGALGELVVSAIAGPAPTTVIAVPPTPTRYDSGGDATSGVIAAAPNRLVEVHGFNSALALRYFQLFDAAAVPANGTVPDSTPILVPPSSNFSISYQVTDPYSVGISWASSTTRATKTESGAPDMWVDARYLPP